MRAQKEYAFYNRNNEFVTIGTKKELAEEIGVKVATIEFYCSPTYRKRTKNGIRVVPLDEDEEGANNE